MHRLRSWSGRTAIFALFLLAGITAQAQVTLTASLSFGSQVVGETANKSGATLKNTQSTPLTISSIALNGPNAGDFTLGGTCPLTPSTLAAGKSCTITVAFTPSALGSRSATVTVTDSASNSPQAMSLSGTGIAPVTVTSTVAFGTVGEGTSSAPKTITVKNNQNVAASITAIALSTSPDFSLAPGGTCSAPPFNLAPLASCTVAAVFTPSKLAAETATLSVSFNGTYSPQITTLSGTGVAPFALSVTKFTFGSVAVGDTSSTAQTLTITNKESSAVNLAFSISGPFQLATTNCGSQIAASPASCFVSVVFAPAAVGAATGTITISDSPAVTAQTVSLSGTGITPVTLSPTTLSFGTAAVGNTTAAKTVTLSNQQNVPLSITSITASSGYVITANTCGSIVAATSTCTVSVVFSPTATGTQTGTLAFADNAAIAPQTVSLNGAGSAPVTFSTSSLSFASQNIGTTSPSQSIKLTNHLSTALSVSSPVTAGDFVVTTNKCGTSVAAGSSCNVSIAFRPSGAGTRSGALLIPYAAYGSPETVMLTGTGVNPLVSIQVTPATATLYAGSTQQYTATGTYADGSTQSVSGSAVWTSTNTSAATVNGGLAQAIAAGSASITASVGTITGSASLSVLASPFTSSGSMVTPRSSHTATLLTDGTVLIAGGQPTTGTGIALASAEIYNAASQTFSAANGSMTSAREGHTATLLPNGRVLIAGGQDDSGNYLATAEIYDPAAQTFTLTGTMLQPRVQHTATLLQNGKVLISGGSNSSGILAEAELYDPVAGTFSIAGTMTDARSWHTATLLTNGKVLIAGGATNGTVYLQSAEIYDPGAGTFTSTATPMNSTRIRHSATLLNNGTVLIAGGANLSTTLATAEIYDPVAGQFTAVANTTAPRLSMGATLLTNGDVLITGGADGATVQQTAELYDPLAQTFTSTGMMTMPRYAHTSTLLANGQVLLAGGIGGVGTWGELYQPASLAPPGLASITVTPASASLSAGASQQFVATGTFSNGTTQILSAVIWSSSNSSAATVTSDATDAGAAYALNAGTATITAAAGSITGSAVVTATAPPVLESITVSPQNATIQIGGTQQFTATGSYSDGSTANLTASVTWSSSDGTASIGNTGLATGMAAGNPIITATLGSVSGSTTLTIAGPVLSSVTVSPTNPTIQIGATQQFTATATYSDGSTQDVTATATWASSAPGIASVSTGGLATGLAPGSAFINASLGNIGSTANLTVLYTAFVQTGTLVDPRQAHTATLLNTGNVLIAGGIDNSNAATANAEVYNPQSKTFTATAAMTTARVQHTATLLANGLVLIAGGFDNSGNYLSSAELYSPATGTFTATGSMTDARAYHSATLLSNGQVLITGGNDGNSTVATAEIYDPLLGTFTATAAMTSPRQWQRSVLLNNGKVLVTGGFDGTNELSGAEIYDPVAGTFTATGSMLAARVRFTATLLNGGNVLVAGGGGNSGTLASAEIYNASTGQFSAAGTMSVARLDGAATLLSNGTVLLPGGLYGSGAQSAADLYDPGSGSFSSAGSMLSARGQHTATLLSDGTVLLAGGTNGSQDIATAELFQPASLTPAGLVSIAVTPANGSVPMGRSLQLIATGTFADGSTQTLASASWISSANALATVASDAGSEGQAYGIATGSITITASTGSISGSTTLSITAAPTLTAITITPANISIAPGATQQFRAIGVYSDGSQQDITAQVIWSSVNASAASMTPSGLATAVAVGSTTISASSGTVFGSTILNVAAA